MGFESTYMNWNLYRSIFCMCRTRFESTYKELKLIWKMMIGQNIRVLSLPIRNWNGNIGYICSAVNSFESTYKELKLIFHQLTPAIYRFV